MPCARRPLSASGRRGELASACSRRGEGRCLVADVQHEGTRMGDKGKGAGALCPSEDSNTGVEKLLAPRAATKRVVGGHQGQEQWR